jgi:UDP-N-acetylglucosamine--N-acetylmuramyl-(pentapeptide) pyrophosphoryl-undecaprenol N-acetylglucosamine transferase
MELALPQIAESNLGLRVHHQTGAADAPRMRDAYARNGIPASVTAFIMSIGEAYAWADIVCARAGATTIAELTYCGLPAVLVPFPKAAARHQHDNALAMEAGGGAVMLEEKPDGTRLAETLIGLGDDPERLATMAASSAASGRGDAAASVADLALSLVDGTFTPRAKGSPAEVA